MKKDLSQIAEIEKAIAEKYGDVATQHPKANWNEEKEEKYLQEIKKLAKKEKRNKEESHKIEKDGFLVAKKLINKESNKACPICNVYSFKSKDDLYMNKFECCFKCYVQWVEHREERWLAGWRPNIQETNDGNNARNN